jgi:hypothetical protein
LALAEGVPLPYWIGGFVIILLLGVICYQAYRLYRKEQSQQRRRALRFELEDSLSNGRVLLAHLQLSAASAPQHELQQASAAWVAKATELLRQRFPAVLQEFQGSAAARATYATEIHRCIADVQALTNILENLLKWF